RLAGCPGGGTALDLGAESPLHCGATLLALGLRLRSVVVGGGSALARRLDPWRLTLLLAVVGRPRGVTLAFRLVPTRQLQERVQRTHRAVDAGTGIADRGEPRRDRRDRERLGLRGRQLVPRQRRGDAGVRQR